MNSQQQSADLKFIFEGIEEENPKILECSFCGKNRQETKILVAGPDNAGICDSCVKVCQEIINEYSEGGKPCCLTN